MRYILPPGSGHHTTIWGLDRHEWGSIHFWIAAAFFTVLAFHLVLHWRWIVSVVMRRSHEGSGLRAGLGIVGLVVIIALALSPLITPVERDVNSKHVPILSAHQYEDTSIRGSMTLNEVAESTGVPLAHLIESLKLPEVTSPEEKLGPLKRKYGFEMNDVRAIVKEYTKSQ